MLLAPLIAGAETAQKLPPVTVTGEAEALEAFGGSPVREQDLAARRAATSDTARLLADAPGVAVNAAGGISSLLSLHGLADDRLRILVDGMSLISACPNHMNPPLSYLDPAQVESIKVWAGLTPVSVGGDAIGGTIAVESAAPEFAKDGAQRLTKGEIGGGYRSNGDAYRGHVSVTQASENISLRYDGAYAQSDNYEAGGDFKNFTATGRPGQDLPRDQHPDVYL
ncbi:MAG TPA: TonB-dependent receptor, partial [Gammaproteobacteria bacterium]|nr:TonB-dependent receptor [Gammaproteobacteria bacterium]